MITSPVTTGYHPITKRTKALERAEKIIRVLQDKRRKRPILMEDLVREAGPHYLEVHQVVATLEALGKVVKYEVEPDHGPPRTAFSWLSE